MRISVRVTELGSPNGTALDSCRTCLNMRNVPFDARSRAIPVLGALVALALPAGITACGGEGESSGTETTGQTLTVYSGREEELVAPLFKRYEEQSGNELDVRYGDSAELAATITEEGDNSPADVYFGQDAGALGALQKEGRLEELPDETLNRVEERYRSEDGAWVGTSGRARVIAYNKEELPENELPDSILDLTDSKWEGKIGWAPTNASFQAFVTALRLTDGENVAKEWLEGIVANEPTAYEKNSLVRDAIADGEVDVGFINHYYVVEARTEEGPDYPVDIYFPKRGDAGALVNVAGAGIVKGTDRQAAAENFVEFLLSDETQEYFADETKEYPLVAGVKQDSTLIPLDQIQQPDIDLNNLDDLKGSLELIEQSGALK